MLRIAVLTMLSTLIALGTGSAAVAQDGARAMVLGTWEGTATFGGSSPAVLNFSESAGTLAWTYSFRYDSVLWGDAAGTVSSLSPPSLALAGAWTKHAVPGAVGTGVKFTLTVDGDQMKGTVIADMNNEPVALSLTRKK
ncbi:MAG TPA: hypothetical protein VMS64_22240 [Candidatus Methylomirabilis sp.]|nr:hypothetical protein [Candidatus Methylomirabilis sp.]